jgi:23S rRNA A2030 N6-methylase RlmJ
LQPCLGDRVQHRPPVGFARDAFNEATPFKPAQDVRGIVPIDPDFCGDRDLIERFAAIEHAEHRVLNGCNVEIAALFQEHSDMQLMQTPDQESGPSP